MSNACDACLTNRNALFEFFRQIQHNVDLGNNRTSRLALAGKHPADKLASRRNVILARNGRWIVLNHLPYRLRIPESKSRRCGNAGHCELSRAGSIEEFLAVTR